MDTTPKLLIPEIATSQATKEVSHNLALRYADALCQLTVKDDDLNTPPGSPADGDRYIVGAVPTGDWVGHALDVAYWCDDSDFDGEALSGETGTWIFFNPAEGWVAWLDDEDIYKTFNGTSWVSGPA